jgi:preprotein translocase subunit SecG
MMNAMNTNTLIFAVVLIVAVGAIVGWVLMQRQRSQRLRRRFGPEYTRAVDELGGR